MKLEKTLEQQGNSRSLRFTPELLHALGYRPGPGEMPVTVSIEPGRITITSPAPSPDAPMPPEAARPETQALLLAVRDQGPANTKQIAEYLGRVPPSTSRALNLAAAAGWVEKSFTGWVLADEARAWFSHVPSEPRIVTPSTRERILSILARGPAKSAKLAAELNIDVSGVHAHLRAAIAEGLVEKRGSEYRLA